MMATDYHKAPVAEKEAIARDRLREPHIACPLCETKTTTADLLAHLESRCPRRPPVHRLARWISRAEALEIGVPRRTLYRWVKVGWVRTEGQGRERRFNRRDLVRALALRRARPPR